MNLKLLATAASVAGLVLVAGCGQKTASETPPPPPVATMPQPPQPPAAEPAAEPAGESASGVAKLASADDLNKVLAQHKGKGILLNFWATWCPPCVGEFPDLVKAVKEYESRGVVFVPVSLDDIGDLAKVESFLSEHEVTTPAYIFSGSDGASFVAGVDKAWEGAIPMTYIIDSEGTKVDSMLGAHDYEAFKAALDKIAKPAG